MGLDKNKTGRTHRATATAAAYLDLRGHKPIETEVQVFDGWIADLASYVYPSNTELVKMKLVAKKKTKYGYCIDDVAVNRFESRYGTGPFTSIVEVKVTKADFQNDMDFKFTGRMFPAHFCYLAYPKGLTEYPPKGWIGLVLNERCDRIIKVETRNCIGCVHPQHLGDVAEVIAQVGIRRHHRTQYAEQRDWLKAFNANETKRKRSYTIHSVLEVLEKYILGGSEKNLNEMLEYHGVRGATAGKWVKKMAEKLKNKSAESAKSVDKKKLTADS